MMHFRVLAAVGIGIALSAGTVLAVNIETVPVGNPGNAADSRYGSFGSVGYRYNIGKYEVTAGQYTEFLNKVAARDGYGLYNELMWSEPYGCRIQRIVVSRRQYAYTVAPEDADRPVNFVSFWDACRFANWLHNGQPSGEQVAGTTETGVYTLNGQVDGDGRTIRRNGGWKWAVTSEDEWYKAAYFNPASGDYSDYPTRGNVAPGRDMSDASGNNANIGAYSAEGMVPIDSGRYTTAAGEFQNSAGWYGTFDQGGNVWERNDTLVAEDATHGYRGVRGGSFVESDIFLLASSREYICPAAQSGWVGFRVVSVPEPGSVILLLAGAVGLLRRRPTR